MKQRSIRTFARRLRQDRRGLAMLEFAFTAPLVLGIGCYGIELANLALVNMKVSQIALNLADNASRVGAYSSLATQQLREVDINDILQAARYQGAGINLTTNGRITISSLENVAQSYDTANNGASVQRIHWQRCLGAQSGVGFDGQFKANVSTAAGLTTATSASDPARGYDLPGGISDNGTAPIQAPGGAGVMYVEINYRTKPLFGPWLTQSQTIHYIASFVVRDRRDYRQIYNVVTTPATKPSTCDLYTT
jgi:Flp pilus assembly protein TadG